MEVKCLIYKIRTTSKRVFLNITTEGVHFLGIQGVPKGAPPAVGPSGAGH